MTEQKSKEKPGPASIDDSTLDAVTAGTGDQAGSENDNERRVRTKVTVPDVKIKI